MKMIKNKNVRGIMDVAFYLIVFLLIQLFCMYIVNTAKWIAEGKGFIYVLASLRWADFTLTGKVLVAISVLSSVLTLSLFVWRKWSPVSRVWLASHPWVTLAWVVMLTIGTILPSEWLVEQMQYTLPESTAKLFESIMKEPWGYLAIGILAPLAEEVVFRGAILRTLLRMFEQRWHWAAIVISALLFGIVHGNEPQGIHATLIGLLLGWMYYRTDSIFPGVVFHWVNNTVAYLLFNMMPQLGDGELIDLFHGDAKMMWLGMGFSLCILLPSLFQLSFRLKKG